MDWPEISAIAAASMAVGAAAKLVYDRAFADRGATEAAIQAAASVGRVNLLATEFSQHKVENASDIAELRTMARSAEQRQEAADRRLVEAEHRIASAIEGVNEQVRDVSKEVQGVNERLNRMLESK
jgi:hypothetical protein